MLNDKYASADFFAPNIIYKLQIYVTYTNPSPLNPPQIYGQTEIQQLSADDQSDFGPD